MVIFGGPLACLPQYELTSTCRKTDVKEISSASLLILLQFILLPVQPSQRPVLPDNSQGSNLLEGLGGGGVMGLELSSHGVSGNGQITQSFLISNKGSEQGGLRYSLNGWR